MPLPGDALAVLAGVFLPISNEEEAGLLPRVMVPKRPEMVENFECVKLTFRADPKTGTESAQ